MTDKTHTAETGTNNNTATASIAEATKGIFVNDCLTRAVVLNTKLEKASRGVMLALATYANTSQHRAWASVPSLARRAGYSQRTTQQQLRELERLGYIRSIKDEVTRVTTTYQIVTSKLLRELCGTAAGAPSVASAKTAPGGEIPAGGGEIPAPGGVKFPHPKKEGIEEGIEQGKEEGGNAHAHATPPASLTTTATFPPLPSSIFENLPALNSPAVARSTALPAAPAPTPAPAPLPTSASPAEPQPAPAPAPSADTLDNTPAPSHTATEAQHSAPADTAAGDTLPADLAGQINAQRAKNGKGKLTRKDMADLATEAAAVGITLADAAAYILASPKRTFLKAKFYKPTSAPAPAAAAEEPTLDAKRAAATLASMIPAAPQTDEEKAAAAQAAAAAKARVRQNRKELQAKQAASTVPAAQTAVPTPPASPVLATTTGPSAHDWAVARQLAQRCAESNCTAGNIAALFTGTSAAPITTAPTTPAAHTGPVAGLLPEVGPKKWAAAIVNRALRGQHVSRGPLEKACAVTGMSFADVQASRITATA